MHGRRLRMDYRRLGNTGLKVSNLCLGTMTFGSNFFNIGILDQSGANQMMTRVMEAGINFFDTADVYSFGESEQILGRAIKEANVRRDAVIIATKVRAAMSQEAINGTGDINN